MNISINNCSTRGFGLLYFSDESNDQNFSKLTRFLQKKISFSVFLNKIQFLNNVFNGSNKGPLIYSKNVKTIANEIYFPPADNKGFLTDNTNIIDI
jgi:hypothetical protein